MKRHTTTIRRRYWLPAIAGALMGIVPVVAIADVPEIMTAGVPPEGSTGYVLTAAIANTVTETTPIKRITLQTFGGAAGWPARMETGEVNFGSHCGFKLVEDAYFGKGPFAKIGRQRNVLNMVTGHGLPFSMSVIDPNVRRIQDLKGKTIFAMMAHEDQKVATEVLAKMAGLDMGRGLRVIPVRSPQEAIQGLLTGRGDGFFFGLIPGLIEVAQAKGLHTVPLTQEVQDAIIKAEPVWGRTVVKAGAPPLRNAHDAPTIEILCGLAAGAKTSPEAVYLVTKTIFENNSWRSAHPLAAEWTLQRAVSIMNAPYHEGAIRYYREKGVWGPEQDRKQKELLSQ
ncbi:MAG: TAXI family TRAP transporter solute-binding subunit [Beijerinckiaceae bacterium]|nr:TAXI family TRAP transporter solute-binding subunit [Beijerinckiaceae bacterium]